MYVYNRLIVIACHVTVNNMVLNTVFFSEGFMVRYLGQCTKDAAKVCKELKKEAPHDTQTCFLTIVYSSNTNTNVF